MLCKIESILSQIAEETRGEGLSRAQIHDRLAKKFLVNTVKGIGVEDVLVQRGSGGAVTIDASYEVRKQLFFNLDVVVVFEDMVDCVLETTSTGRGVSMVALCLCVFNNVATTSTKHLVLIGAALFQKYR